MRSAYTTTIDPSAATVLLIATESVFVTQLTIALEAAHLSVERVHPNGLLSLRKDQSVFATLWIDVPIFTDQNGKLLQGKGVIQQLHSVRSERTIFVTFDTSHQWIAEAGKKDPFWASEALVREFRETVPKGIHLEFLHTLYPYEGGLSIAQRYIFEKIQAANTRPCSGDFSPIWYGDVLDRLITSLYLPDVVSGRWTGTQSITYKEFEELLRHHRGLEGVATGQGRFPYIFPQGEHWGSTPLLTMIEEIGVVVPLPKKIETFSKEEVPFLITKPITASKKPIPTSTILARVLLAIFGIFILLYLCIVLFFLQQFLSLRSAVQTIYKPINQQNVQVVQEQSLLRTNRLLFLVKTVPIPYELFGLGVPRSEVVAGLTFLQSLLNGIQQTTIVDTILSDRHKNLSSTPLEQTESDALAARLDEAYKDLSGVQARLSQGDRTLDVLFSTDGLTENLRQQVTSLRDAVSEQKVAISLLPTLVGSTGQSTIAVVVLENSQERPFFGTPKEVTLYRFEQGKLHSHTQYPIDEVDNLLKGVVSVPPDAPTFFQPRTWRLSDGVFSVNGPSASRQIAWFLEKQFRVSVDAVIAVDASAMASLITPNNNTAVLGITKAIEDTTPSQIEKVQQLFRRAEAVLYVKETAAAQTVHALGWDGAVRTPSCPSRFSLPGSCDVRTTFLSDISFDDQGIATREQEVSYRIGLDGMSMEHVVLYNSSQTHQRYVKVLVDPDAVLEGVYLEDGRLDDSTVFVSEEFGKRSIAAQVILPQDKARISFRIHYPSVVSPNESIAFFVQKQLGVSQEPLRVTVQYDQSLFPKIVAPAPELTKQQLRFLSDLSESRLFAVGF